MRPVIAVLACAACGRLGFGAFAGDGGGGSGDDDGSVPGSGSDLSGTCLSPGYGDGFDEVLPCNAFGMLQVTNAGMNVMNSQLTISPNASTMSTAGCERVSGAFGAAGTFIEISQVLPPPGQTLLEITGTSTSFTAGIIVANGLLTYSDSAGTFTMMPYNPSAHRWWRIRPAGDKLVAETSPNGKGWTMFASATTASPSDVAIAAYVQSDTSNTTPGAAVFQGIDVCPP
jgi:uncharacterized membrane protein YphA (DoxX/SURF4 family)